MADPTALPPQLIYRSKQELLYAILVSALGLGPADIGPLPTSLVHRSEQELLYAIKAAIDALVAGGGGGAVWGAITGTLTDQTDLVAALATKPTASLDTDGTLAANSNTRVPSQAAVVTYISAMVAGLLDFKGNTDCSTNPNYPAALKGDAYVVSVAGKIGGASGEVVEIGDVYIASADNAGGTEASVGTSWFVLQANITGITATGLSLMRAASAAAALAAIGGIGGTVGTTDNAIPRSDGTGGFTVQDSLAKISDEGRGWFQGGQFNRCFVGTGNTPEQPQVGLGSGNNSLMQFIVDFVELMLLENGANQRLTLASAVKLAWSPNGSVGNGGSPDSAISRLGVAILALGNIAMTQGLKVDASSGNTAITSVAGNLHISTLPTTNPGPGILWNDSGAPAIGT